MRMLASWRQRVLRRAQSVEVAGLALLAYVPSLVSSPGQLSSDTKQYLYLDPGRFLARAVHLWDPQVGAGTVSHQHIGYLFPMGPWFWVFDQLGVPDWIAQRLWWGTISLAAALGARWLFKLAGARGAGPVVGAVVYLLTPYQLAFTARISVLLLPWAALPWLVGLVMRATRRGGWRDPALFALVALTAGGVNAPTLLLVCTGPALWLVLEALRGRAPARRVLAATGRIGVLSLGVSIWWLVGLRVQGAYGLPVLQLTERVQVVSANSSPDDLLRGLGNWFFYGRDRLGSSIDQAASYAEPSRTAMLSFTVPVLALAAAAVVRWRHRTYFALLVVVGAVVGAGAWPYDDPSPYGSLWRSFADTSSLGLALRNTARVAPVIVLGLAGLVAAAIGSVLRRRPRAVAALAVAAVAVAAFAPVWRIGYLSSGVQRPEDVPDHWRAAAADLDAAGDSTRVLEIPGANFSAYRWGNTVEPITPGLIDRPYLAREVLPYGSPASVNLLDALDRRMQQGTFEPASLAPVARMFDVGTVSLRSDLQFERFGTPRPRLLWSALTAPLAPGLEPPRTFGPAERNTPSERLPSLDELELRTPPSAPDPPPVALFDVEDPLPIVHTAPTTNPVVLAGDGDGVVEAAGAGLLDGRALLFQLAALDDPGLEDALDAGADLVLTDSHRRRPQNWFSSLRETMGATERAGQDLPDPSGLDFRLEPFGDVGDGAHTVVEHEGGRVDATADGGTGRPEDRAVLAFDGDSRTSWRVGGPDPTGERLTIELDGPVTADGVTLVQPQDGPRDRVLTVVRLSLDGGEPTTVTLGEESLEPGGQRVPFPERSVRRLELELVETTVPAFDPGLANAVGFAEVGLADVQVVEAVRLPVDLAERVGEEAAGHRLDVVMSRLRSEPGERGRQDQELSLERRFELPDERSFGLAGTARVNPGADDDLLDEVLGTVAPGTTFTSSGHLHGDPDARASRAFDADPGTAWTAPLGAQEGQWVAARVPAPLSVDRADLTVVADGRHSVPTRVRLEADGAPVASVPVPEIADGAVAGATTTVSVSFEPVQAQDLRLVVEEVRRRTAIEGDPAPEATLPVAFAEVGLAGVVAPGSPTAVPDDCRSGLLTIDGRDIPLRLEGSPSEGRSGLTVEPCGGAIAVGAGSNRLGTRPGLDTGVDIDRLVLSSDEAGAGDGVAPRGRRAPDPGAAVQVDGSGPTQLDLTVTSDGEPFWLVLGQSSSEGWQADVGAGSLGPRQLVNGFANGWLVTPTGPGTMEVALRWTPQRQVWAGLALSLAAALACVAVVAATTRRSRSDPDSAGEGLAAVAVLGSPASYPVGVVPSIGMTAVAAAAAGLAAAAVSVPWIGVVTGAALALVARAPAARWLVTLSVPALLVASRLAAQPRLAWLALALLAVDIAVWLLRSRRQAQHGQPATRSAPRPPRSG